MSTRRQTLKYALAAATFPSAPLFAQKPDPPGAGAPFKLGLVTYNLARDWDVPTIIKNCEATGFEAAELRTTHKHGVEPHTSAAFRTETCKRFADSKVRLLSLGTATEFQAIDQTVVRKNVDEAKRFIELAHDLGCLGIKVRPNGLPKEVSEEKTISQIGAALRELGEHGQAAKVEIWVEVHGAGSSHPPRIAEMMKAAAHPQVGVCWNSNPEDLMGGASVTPAFDLVHPYLRNCHINELWNEKYPYAELFTLLKGANYNRYTLAEIPETSDPIRLMKYYRGLWSAMQK